MEFNSDGMINPWCHIEKMKHFQVAFYNELQQPRDFLAFSEIALNDKVKENILISDIEDHFQQITQSMGKGEVPILRVPKKQKNKDSNMRTISEELISACNSRTGKRFAMLVTLLSKSHELILSNSFATLRDIYYENVNLYGKQNFLDKTVDDLSRILGVPRRTLRITATGKGLIGGNLSFTNHINHVVNITAYEQGIAVPDYVNGIYDLKSDAKFILVIEKDATFQNVMQSNFIQEFGSCILITGKGYPDVCSRQMLQRLWSELKIPALALVDADPYGLHIASVYKFGSIAKDEPSLQTPGLALLGVLPSELTSLKVPEKALLELNPRDQGKLASLASHPEIKKNQSWLYQIEALRKLEKKAEIQCLTHISPNYLTSVYLPSKISTGAWIV